GYVHESLPIAASSVTSASRCGSFTGSERRIRLLTSEKIAVFAPIPRASESTATAVTIGAAASWRIAIRTSWAYPTPRHARGRFDSSRNEAASSTASARRRASSSVAPRRIWAACRSARCVASSSTTSSESSRHSRSARSRTSVRHRRISGSRITHSGKIADQREELAPFLPLRGEDVAPLGGETVVAPAPLPGLLDRAALNPLALLELVERGVERGEVEGEQAARSLLDQLRQFVAVTGAVVEKREDQQLGGALLRFADRAGGLHAADYILESRI